MDTNNDYLVLALIKWTSILCVSCGRYVMFYSQLLTCDIGIK